MKLLIPTIGTKLELTKKWSFDLQFEHRNSSVMAYFGVDRDNPKYRPIYGYPPKFISVSFPKGTILIVDRIYIRSGGADIKKYDSVTFRVILPDGTTNFKTRENWGNKLKNVRLRFWAKLSDVNNIYCKEIE